VKALDAAQMRLADGDSLSELELAPIGSPVLEHLFYGSGEPHLSVSAPGGDRRHQTLSAASPLSFLTSSQEAPSGSHALDRPRMNVRARTGVLGFGLNPRATAFIRCSASWWRCRLIKRRSAVVQRVFARKTAPRRDG
jgi:hypothetical protein